MRFDDRPVAVIDMAGGQGGTLPSPLLTETFRPPLLKFASGGLIEPRAGLAARCWPGA
jgi:hypothetical protein